MKRILVLGMVGVANRIRVGRLYGSDGPGNQYDKACYTWYSVISP